MLIAVNGVMASMVGAARDLDRGITDRLRTLPISRAATLLGQALADLLVNAAVLAAMVGVGFAVGWRVHDGAGRALGALGLLLLLRFAVVWAGFFLGMLCGREEIAAQAGVLVFPVGMVSNVFVPTGGMPGWLRAIADWNPVSRAAAGSRSLFGDTIGAAASSPWPLAHPVAATLAWCAVLPLVFVPLAVRTSQRPRSVISPVDACTRRAPGEPGGCTPSDAASDGRRLALLDLGGLSVLAAPAPGPRGRPAGAAGAGTRAGRTRRSGRARSLRSAGPRAPRAPRRPPRARRRR